MVETVAMARSLGETHGWRERHTAFDLWHLAAAWLFSAAAFLTFDKRQARIAKYARNGQLNYRENRNAEKTKAGSRRQFYFRE